jgi:MerR family mercuric resistance operon transcriptional regulator
MTTGGLAHRAQVHPQTVRYYERRGLLPRVDRSANGRRSFSEDVLQQLRFIKHVQRLGFSLREIKDELLPLWKEQPTNCQRLRDRVLKKIHEIDRELMELVAVRQNLNDLVNECSGHDPLETCPIAAAEEKTDESL